MKLPTMRPTTYQLYIIFAILLVCAILLMPPNPATLARYQLATPAYRILMLATTALPALLTWGAAFYGYEELRKYQHTIRKTKEGEAFRQLTDGSRWVALYLPVVTILALVLGGVANTFSGFRSVAMAWVNYVAIGIAIAAYMKAGSGARQLCDNAGIRPSLLKTRVLTLAFIVMGVFYCYFIVRHSLAPGGTPYFMPLGLMLISVVVPYFFAWMMGLLAVLDIDAYATNVPGVLFRRALRQLSWGLLIIICSSILLQYVNSANTERGRLVLGSVLVMRYVLYAGVAAGFGLIGNSAKKLQQIEKI